MERVARRVGPGDDFEDRLVIAIHADDIAMEAGCLLAGAAMTFNRKLRDQENAAYRRNKNLATPTKPARSAEDFTAFEQQVNDRTLLHPLHPSALPLFLRIALLFQAHPLRQH